jgi:tRNA threonylcarbamoyladenosine biosynthesis protein TsaB
VLGLDTSAGATVGLVGQSGDGIVRVAEHPRHQVEELAPLIGAVLAEAAVRPDDLAGVAVGVGPAPYTGLRIGLALGLPVWGVGSLDALAATAIAQLELEPGSRLLATGDARRREIYWALYRLGGDGETILEQGPAVGPASEAPAADVAVGGGAVAYPDVLTPMPGGPLRPNPAVLARLALARATAGVPQPSSPVYLRRPDVAPPAPRKRVTA